MGKNRHSSGWTVVAALLLIASPATAQEAEPADSAARAERLYDQGNCAEALPLLEQLTLGDSPDGVTLYRLYFCQLDAGSPEARRTLGRARTALEAELATAQDLAVPFYLANAQRNSARLSEAQHIAAEATGRVESGEWPEPTDGMGCFRLGKLYADQQRMDEARRWYDAALTRFESEGALDMPAARWAARDLAGQAYDAGEFATAEKYYTRLLDGGAATAEELDRLAMARVRLGLYRAAAAAWSKAVIANPAAGNRPRYCAQLAWNASEVGELPAVAPDGRPWSELDRAALEAVMLEQAQAAREIKAAAGVEVDPRADPAAIAAAAKKLTPEQRTAMRQELAAARALFAAAGLEYALRGFPVRETAFRAGYAPMIFHARHWKPPGE